MGHEKIEPRPALCAGTDEVSSHPYQAGQVVVGFKPCTCRTSIQPAGHRWFWCQLPGCGVVVHVPTCIQDSNAVWDNGLTPPDRTGGADRDR